MAELPDLTVFAENLTRKFAGKILDRLEITVSKKLNVSESALRSALEGRKLLNVTREGRTLQFHFEDDQALGMPLMLRGELVSLDDGVTPKFQIIAFHFKGDVGFAVPDLQKQATPTLHPKTVDVPHTLDLDEDYFRALLAKKRMVIKTLLMDQKLMRGIGNSYADDAKALPKEAVTRLFKSIRTTVLEKAIKEIAAANGDELTGELKDFMQVHSLKLKHTIKGEPIKTETIGGRTTYYVNSQELFV